MKAFCTMQIKELENACEKSGLSRMQLMENAAAGMFEALQTELAAAKHMAILCGRGNNGGDGYALALLLRRAGYDVTVITAVKLPPDAQPAKTFYEEYVAAFGEPVTDRRSACAAMMLSDLIIDAVCGIGLSGGIDKETTFGFYIDFANHTNAVRVALDVPSGINADDGTVRGVAFRADVTLTVIACKIGMCSYPAKENCGKVRIIDIGISSSLVLSKPTSFFLPDNGFVDYFLPHFGRTDHKGDHGKVLLVCGSEGMTGAAALATAMTLRAGAGLVTLASEKSVTDVIKVRSPEALTRTISWESASDVNALLSDVVNYDAVLCGCGLGKSAAKERFVRELCKKAHGRVVLDADGINLLKAHIDVLKEAAQIPVLTPHPGEFARLAGMTVDAVNADRLNCAYDFARTYRCFVALKGAATVTASPDGRISVGTSGTPGLAKGGSGDVLAGLLAGLLASHRLGTFEAVSCAVYLHGVAAEQLESTLSAYAMLPSDLILAIGKLLP